MRSIGWTSILVLAGCTSMEAPFIELPRTDAHVAGDAGAPDATEGDPDAGPSLPPPVRVGSSPPLAGGTLLVTRDGVVIAADPDHAALWFVEGIPLDIRRRLDLAASDEPGRMVEDGAGRVHVVLRRAGTILDVDPDDARVLSRRPVCGAPRGIDWEASTDLLHVACATGELVSLPASGGEPTRLLELGPDLRDVVVADGVLYVSRFRTAELLTIDASGALVETRRPPTEALFDGRFRANTAWRLRAAPDGGVVMLHQASSTDAILPVERGGGYGGGVIRDRSAVEPSITLFPASGDAVASGLIEDGSLLVDLGVDPAGRYFHVVSAANGSLSFTGTGIYAIPVNGVAASGVSVAGRGPHAAVAVSYTRDGRPISLGRDPVQLRVAPVGAEDDQTLHLASIARDRGDALFHARTPSGLACASCHPEGADDAHVWTFSDLGMRRTQSLLGGLTRTAPFHWGGEQRDMNAIIGTTLPLMGLLREGGDEGAAHDLELWLDPQPAPPGVRRDEGAIARGRVIFANTDAGCAGCHAGEALTNNENADVGTGGAFQVPSLIGVMYRAPYFHDGCAPSLDDVVIGACATLDRHGRTSHLDEAARSDLAAYLRSL